MKRETLVCKEKFIKKIRTFKNKSMASHPVKTMLFKEITARNNNKKIFRYHHIPIQRIVKTLFLQRSILKI